MEYAGYITKAPLVESIDSSTGSGHHTPRVCTIEEYQEYVHIVKSDLRVQANGKTPNVAIESLHASAGHLNPPAYISFASSKHDHLQQYSSLRASRIDSTYDTNLALLAQLTQSIKH